MASKLVRWLVLKAKKQQQIAKTSFFLSNQIPQNNNVCHYVYSPTKEEPLIFYML
jgi:hypothetical protein